MAITDLEDWLYTAPSREQSGIYDDVKLEPIKKILAHWECHVRPITVAGTKGKGSTLRFIESGLNALGKTSLSFTSPHVFQINERWRFNGIPLNQNELIIAAEAVATAEDKCQVALTYFERCFAMAVYLSQALDYFLCEVGLGGRLDCANALDTQLAVITALSYDHCHILGNTLHEIAGEKLGIARSDAALIIGPQSADARTAINDQLPPCSSIHWVTAHEQFDLALRGAHQQANANTALQAILQIDNKADQKLIKNTFKDVHLAGRCQLINDTSASRNILVDAAHNGESMQACMRVAEELLTGDWSIIIGIMKDKQIEDVLAALPTDKSIIRCGFDWPRACGEEDWPVQAQQWPYYATIKDALASLAAEQDCCICGSFYLAGEALVALDVEASPG